MVSAFHQAKQKSSALLPTRPHFDCLKGLVRCKQHTRAGRLLHRPISGRHTAVSNVAPRTKDYGSFLQPPDTQKARKVTIFHTFTIPTAFLCPLHKNNVRSSRPSIYSCFWAV